MPEFVGTLTLPKKAGATPTADGQIEYDTTADRVEYGDGSATKQVARADEVATNAASKIYAYDNLI